MSVTSEQVQAVIDKLPDPAGARLFAERLQEEHASIAARVIANQELYINILTLAAYSPLLAETMLQHPDYIIWLSRERDLNKVKSKEVMLEDLARFAAVNSALNESVQLARFKRRELLRIYLRDCLKLATLSETAEEFSNLADAILERALQSCYQPLLARYGKPQTKDERDRLIGAEFTIVSLGKLGSRELNYSSDIDPIFIYSADGSTSGGRESIPNKQFFTKLAEAVVKMVGAPFGEGAVFRVDLRLRPRGREGDLVVSLAEAIRYYRDEAQNWERQALVRARASAGEASIVERFLLSVRDLIFRPEPLVAALADVRRAKEKIDTHTATRVGGYNVKLGKGGIREIEFIVQALQICYGGQDAWLRAPQTLIGMQRLTDKGLLTDSEHTRLAQAYTFLRLVEHRLQMEHGLQTHSLPLAEERLELLARRLGFASCAAFEQELENHCRNVTNVYERVFSQTTVKEPRRPTLNKQITLAPASDADLMEQRLFEEAITNLMALPGIGLTETAVADAATAGLNRTVNRVRALRRMRDYAQSAAAGDDASVPLSADQIRELTIIGGSSHYFIQTLISYPRLVNLLGRPLEPPLSEFTFDRIYRLFDEAVNGASFDEANLRLRRCWHEQMLAIGRHDLIAHTMTEMHELRAVNRAQTALAEAALAIGCRMACELAAQQYERTAAPLIYTVLGLGRLGHRGIDYNSDLDIIFVYSDETGNVATRVTNQEFYARVVEHLIQILTALTREGTLYRIDLRLRPEGRNGLLATSFDNLQQYVSERAAIWELMAYLKLRAVLGDADFSARVERRAIELVFQRARQSADSLAHEAADMRARLMKEKARGDDFKFGAGGMLDVYFATRYLQLHNEVADPPERGTLALVEHLGHRQLLTPPQVEAFYQGYSFLRRLDHQVRLQLDRPQSALPHNPVQLLDLAHTLGFDSVEAFVTEYRRHLDEIRATYLEIISSS